jgi:A118 family predicted phage portal protein
MQDEVRISNLEKPLFAYYRVPGANTVDPSSPLGLSVFSNALTELKAVDISISRKNTEVEDSKHITFVGQTVISNAQNRGIELPRFVMGLGMGLNDGETTSVHEHVPTMLTDQRIKDINFNLSMAGVKCGFSEGVFVLDGQTGMITATQVEADDRDTIQTIKTDRDALRDALEQAIYGADALITLYGLAPLGEYELNFNFGDITYSYEEDKAAWRLYAMQGWIPKWLYFVKFEGMSEEEAKAFTAEAQAATMEAELFSGGGIPASSPAKKDDKKQDDKKKE